MAVPGVMGALVWAAVAGVGQTGCGPKAAAGAGKAAWGPRVAAWVDGGVLRVAAFVGVAVQGPAVKVLEVQAALGHPLMAGVVPGPAVTAGAGLGETSEAGMGLKVPALGSSTDLRGQWRAGVVGAL